MAINSRQKGRRGELEVAKLISQALDFQVKLNYDQSATGGYDMKVWGWAVEVKRAENPDWRAWQRQALNSAWKDGLMPILFHRRNHARYWDVYLPISVFLVVWGGQGPLLRLFGYRAWWRWAVWRGRANSPKRVTRDNGRPRLCIRWGNTGR